MPLQVERVGGRSHGHGCLTTSRVYRLNASLRRALRDVRQVPNYRRVLNWLRIGLNPALLCPSRAVTDSSAPLIRAIGVDATGNRDRSENVGGDVVRQRAVALSSVVGGGVVLASLLPGVVAQSLPFTATEVLAHW